MKRLLTLQEVADYLAVSEAHVKRLVKAGELPCYQIRTLKRFNPDDIAEYLNRCASQPASPPQVAAPSEASERCEVCGRRDRHEEWCSEEGAGEKKRAASQ